MYHRFCYKCHISQSSSLFFPQDRLVLSMEQELVRAHQRATKCHTPISACAVLLERLLPRGSEQLAGTGEVQNLAVKQPMWESTVQKPEENQRCVIWVCHMGVSCLDYICLVLAKICCLY